MLKSILILLFLLIVSMATYSVLEQKEAKQNTQDTTQNKKILEKKQKVLSVQNNSTNTKQTKHADRMNVQATDEDENVLTTTTDKPFEISESSQALSETLKHTTYEEIQNDTTLTAEDKEIMTMDKVYFETKTAEPSVPMTEEEVLKMVEEDMQNELPTNEIK